MKSILELSDGKRPESLRPENAPSILPTILYTYLIDFSISLENICVEDWFGSIFEDHSLQHF